MSEPTELDLLHAAMVEVGIWPIHSLMYKDSLLKDKKVTTLRGNIIPRNYALAIMRGIAEDWLMKRGWKITQTSWYYMAVPCEDYKGRPMRHYEALRHAHAIKSSTAE